MKDIEDDLNKRSGLLGISDVSKDMRDIIKAMQEGYCPTSQDRNIHADFSSGVRRISEFGSKKTRVRLISKRQGDDARFSFEKDDFGYSFKKE